MAKYSQFAREVFFILSALSTIAGLIFWAIRSKLKDEFCEKNDCNIKHNKLDKDLSIYRSGITDDIREIKDMVKEITGWVFDFIKAKQ